jgi:hypothetical protein
MQHKDGSIIEAVILKNAPTSDMRSPKKGRERATMTLLITRAVPMKRLNGLFLPFIGSQLLVAFTIGMIIRAYFVMGLTSVVYIVSLELSFSVGRFKVICD